MMGSTDFILLSDHDFIYAFELVCMCACAVCVCAFEFVCDSVCKQELLRNTARSRESRSWEDTSIH